MAVSYKKLWKLLIDKDMNKKNLREAAGISSSSMGKLGKHENVINDKYEIVWQPKASNIFEK